MYRVLALFLSLALVPSFRADEWEQKRLDNWHQWRGPLANGFCPKGDPPIRWSEKSNIKWKAPLPGRGSSTPIIWQDNVFILAAIDTGRQATPKDIPKPDPRYEKRTKAPTTYHEFIVLCFDRQTGKERWRRVAAKRVPHEGVHPTHSYAGFSPVTDGQFLYVSFGSYGVYCYDFDGNLKWQREFGRMETRRGWGEASSPALHKGTLVITWDHEGPSFITALDARTGKTRWRQDRDEVTSWATPLIVDFQGRSQVIVNATNRVRSYDLNTGEVIWECGGQTVNVIPSPIACGDFVVCMSGYQGSCAKAIPLHSKGDVTDKAIWQLTRGTPYVPSPLLLKERIYFTQSNAPILTSVEAKTGKIVLHRERLPGLRSLYASPVGVKDRIYIVDRDGTTAVIQHADALKVLSVNRLDDGIDASPAIAGDELFLRGAQHLYCIAE
ncbi:MAG: hypothetical protein KatS3mg105_4794 [Gemmatales bacterium]|nr:MAG: hypothetical protein KatS3mg105_4794 [Gemmatales bacterium]